MSKQQKEKYFLTLRHNGTNHLGAYNVFRSGWKEKRALGANNKSQFLAQDFSGN